MQHVDDVCSRIQLTSLRRVTDEQSVTDSLIREQFQEQPLEIKTTFDGSLHGQPCSMTLEAAQFTGWPRPVSSPVSNRLMNLSPLRHKAN